MLDRSTPKGRLVEAAMKLAEARAWGDVALMDIAREAGLTLLDLKGEVSSKDDIVAAFGRAVDDEVLRRSQPQAGGAGSTAEPARDRVFGVIMTRFDVLQPYRTALRSILKDAGPAGAAMAMRRMLRSQHWMLAAAGIPTDSVGGAVRVAGLAAVYAEVFRTWLGDEDPGMAKTMAVLDNRLRNGERWLRSFDDLQSGMQRMRTSMSGFKGFDSKAWRERQRPGQEDRPASDDASGSAML